MRSIESPVLFALWRKLVWSIARIHHDAQARSSAAGNPSTAKRSHQGSSKLRTQLVFRSGLSLLAQFKAFLILLNQFHQMIIKHDDIAERNLFVTEAPDGALGPLILDFGSSHVECHPPPSECKELAEVFQNLGVPMDWLAEAAEQIKFKVLGVNWPREEAKKFSALSASTFSQDSPDD
jgi:hypothetical protein